MDFEKQVEGFLTDTAARVTARWRADAAYTLQDKLNTAVARFLKDGDWKRFETVVRRAVETTFGDPWAAGD